MREQLFLGTALLAGICLVGIIGVVLKGIMYVVSHLHVVWS